MAVIGIMDSGVGGLSVFREILKLLPDQHYIYYSDNAHCPYGEKSQEYIRDRLHEITDFFISNGADAVVLACNTATAAAIEDLRGRYDIPFVGMEPAVKPAALGTKTGVIGVLATAGTLKGSKYLNTKGRFADDVTIIERVGQGFVELVESGKTSGAEAESVVKAALEPLLEQGADRIVLGCTHYPFLLGTLKKVAADLGFGDIEFIDPAPAVAKRLVQVLEEKGVSTKDNNPITELFASGSDAHLKELYATLNIRTVSAVIVSMDRPDMLEACVQSIQEQNVTPVDLWIVAYRYSPENFERIKARFPSAHIVESDGVRGFSENNNLALRQLDSDYVFIVNDDTVQTMPVVDTLLEDFAKLPDNVAAISPKIVFPDGRLQTCGRGPWTAWRWMRHYLHMVDETKPGKWSVKEGLFRTWTLNGACFLARTDAFREAGWFDEYYAFTPEDIALGHMFNDMGWTVYADADVSITHFAGGTISEKEAVIKPVRIMGSLHFHSRGSRIRFFLLACYAWLVEAARYMKYLIKGCRTDRDRIMKASARNVIKAVFSGKSPKELLEKI